ncbi:MAG: alginate O-acetyltransferase AlgF [Marinosulfonomonas sp.]
MRIRTLVYQTAFTVFVSTPLFAQNEVLYEAPPPDDAAFVRFVGFDGVESTAWNGLNFRAGELGLDDYFVIHSEAAGLTEGDFITVIPGPDGNPISLIEPAKSVEKVVVALINLSSTALDLKTADGAIAIITGVEPLGAGFREVNPTSIAVQAFEGVNAVGEPVARVLRRGKHISFIAAADGTLTDLVSEIHPGVVE